MRLFKRLSKKIPVMFHHTSIVKTFTVQFLPLAALFSALFIAGFFALLSMTRNNTYREVKQLIHIYYNQLSYNLNKEIAVLIENCSSNSDIALLNTATDSINEYNYIMRIKKLLSGQLSLNSVVDGYFVYFPSKNIFVPGYNSSSHSFQEGYLYPSLIQSILSEQNQQATLSSLNTKNWFLLTENGQNYFIRIVRSGSGALYAGAWIHTTHFPFFEVPQAMDSLCFLVDESGNYLTGENPGMVIPPADKLQSYFLPNRKHYVAISERLPFCDYSITVLISSSYLIKTLAPFLWFFAFFMGWLFLFFFSLSRLVRRTLLLPATSLQPIVEEIHKGSFDTRLVPPNDYEEIVAITDSFNTMISEIQNLKIHVYEEKLRHQEFELKFLKTQTAPHFLINCLNTILVSSQNRSNQEITDQMILTLSDHLRYTLSNRSTVSLKEELFYLENYLKFTQYRFPGSLSYQIECPQTLENTRVFPLILLTLTENSIKTGLIMGEPFLIRVGCTSYFQDGSRRVCLKHTDSGTGLSPEQLHNYNHVFTHPEVTKKGTGIGIYNTAMRLKLILGEDSAIRFYNEPEFGLSVELDFSYQEYTEDEPFKTQ